MSEVKEKLRENLKAKQDDDKVEIVKDEISGIEYKMPTNFFIRDGKILKLEDGKVKRVCATLVWPTAIIQNLDNGEEKIQLEIKRRGEVKKGIYEGYTENYIEVKKHSDTDISGKILQLSDIGKYFL